MSKYIFILFSFISSSLFGQSVIAPDRPENGDIIQIYDKDSLYWSFWAVYDEFTVTGISNLIIDYEQCKEMRDSLFVLNELQETIILNKEDKINNLKGQLGVKDKLIDTKEVFIKKQEVVLDQAIKDKKKRKVNNTIKDIGLFALIGGLTIALIVVAVK